MNKKSSALLLGVVLVVGGCTLAPKYDRPNLPVPTAWPTTATNNSIATGVDTHSPKASELDWEQFFTDANLRQLIGIALTNNRDLRLAALNVERARAMYGIQRGQLMPTVDAAGSGSVQRQPADLSGTGSRHTSERYDVNLGVASWELDFFGRIRSLKDRSLQEYFATEQARRSAQILLVSAVANTYLGLAADRETLEFAQDTLLAQQDAYNLIKRRYELGLVSDLDLNRARTQVDAARGDAARLQQVTAQDENALNLLLGTVAPAELLPVRLTGLMPSQDIAAGLPSEILLRRPDVLQAEHLLKGAHADIGAARAAFFPRISLTAAIGTASSDLSGLFKSGSGAWSYAPQIVMPIFDTRTWSAHKAAKVQQEIAVTQYERAIQSAFREVADVLAVRSNVDEQLAAQESLVQATSETHRLSAYRYDKGLESYLAVLDAQRSLYAAQQGLVAVQLAKLASSVQLYTVSGGAWQDH